VVGFGYEWHLRSRVRILALQNSKTRQEFCYAGIRTQDLRVTLLLYRYSTNWATEVLYSTGLVHKNRRRHTWEWKKTLGTTSDVQNLKSLLENLSSAGINKFQKLWEPKESYGSWQRAYIIHRNVPVVSKFIVSVASGHNASHIQKNMFPKDCRRRNNCHWELHQTFFEWFRTEYSLQNWETHKKILPMAFCVFSENRGAIFWKRIMEHCD